jgi:hypothetical protein
MNTPSPVIAAPTLSPAKAARKAAWVQYQIALEAEREASNRIADLRAAGQREAAEALLPEWRELLAADLAAWRKFCACDTPAARAY